MFLLCDIMNDDDHVKFLVSILVERISSSNPVLRILPILSMIEPKPVMGSTILLINRSFVVRVYQSKVMFRRLNSMRSKPTLNA